MVGIPDRSRRLTLALACAALSLAAQTRLSLKEAGARNPSAGYLPTHVDSKVILRGVVNALPWHFPDYSLLTFEDGQYGAVIHVTRPDSRLDAFVPGDEIEVAGTLVAFAGMPVVHPDDISHLSRKLAPEPLDIPL